MPPSVDQLARVDEYRSANPSVPGRVLKRDEGVLAGPYVPATTYKEWDRIVTMVVDNAGNGIFEGGRDRSFGLDDDYAVGVEVPDQSIAVSEALWSRVVERCSRIRQRLAATEEA